MGSVIDVTVNFDLPVTVSGLPQIARLNSGGTATYLTGSGTSSLSFTYTVGAGENSADLDYTSAGALTGGSISNMSVTSVLANLTLPAPGGMGSLGFNKNIAIDTIAPSVVQYNVLFGSKSYNLIGSSRAVLPWRITGVQIVFSEPIGSGDLNSLTGLSNTGFSGLGTSTLTWTINPLINGHFLTNLLGSGIDALKDIAGNPLYSGAGYAQNFNVLYGDFNGDGVVTSADMVGVYAASAGPYNIFADINGDGIVDINDVQVVRTRAGSKL